MSKKIKAVGLFSGGLDSLLAIKVMESQGIEVHGFCCKSAFFGNTKKLKETAQKNNIHLHIKDISKEYISVAKEPRYGYGKNMNPCVDCKIFMIQQAKKYAENIGAQIIFTGEVVGQRPMSQQKKSMSIIEKKSGMEGRLLRPLSAKILPPTEAEKKGWIQREKMLDINGRGRTRQFELAKKYNLQDFESPSGGCLLTEDLYSKKLKDIFQLKKRIFLDDIRLLKIGRYFRDKKTLIIVGRNQEDNEKIETEKKTSDWIFKVEEFPGPLTLVRGPKKTHTIYTAAALTARYAKAPEKAEVTISYGKNREQKMRVQVPSIEDCEKLKEDIQCP